ncbi:hypothetical protein QBC38DRAFT_492436 [Podospora fimiseda]|uniref:Uncharacterized protein n=1 Tax=Podospora fimiseda TaxID=252190 RepID=A0AAN7BD02_9PEZI|nr:hypothetical protein QBC38DRAFT_492436 [Podospora fimiseda]
MAKYFQSFVENIPANKLEHFSPGKGQQNLYKEPIRDGSNWRLNRQGITTDNYHNLQIQANRKAKSLVVRKMAPLTVSTVLVWGAAEPPIYPEVGREAFLVSYDMKRNERLGGPAVKDKEMGDNSKKGKTKNKKINKKEKKAEDSSESRNRSRSSSKPGKGK